MTQARRATYILILCMALMLGACAERHPRLKGLDVKQFRTMAGQMVMVGFRGLELDGSEPIMADVRDGLVGGVVLFSRDVALQSPVRNVQSPEQVRTLTAALQRQSEIPLFVAVDQEGGRVARFTPEHGFAPTVSAQELGRGDPETTREAARNIGAELAEVGVNIDLAPVVDVNVNPDNPAIGAVGRSFSADPESVAKHGLAFVRGLHQAGVLSSLKHFPGHGSAWNDSHLGMADITETWSETELTPYARIIPSGEADTVMTAHVFNARLDADYPATLSHAVLSGLLRQKLGFKGVVFSDDMQMRAITTEFGLEKAVTLAVNAGVDVLLFGNNLEYDPALPRKISDILLQKVIAGEIPVERIRESYNRVMQLKERLANMKQ